MAQLPADRPARAIIGPMQRDHTPAYDAAFHPLTSLEDLEAAVTGSFIHPVVIFKHSFSCGTSAEAHEELESALEQGVAGRWYRVDVRASRRVSLAIAERFAIRHESPQLLLLVAGQVRWHASHYRVTRAAIDAALAQNAIG